MTRLVLFDLDGTLVDAGWGPAPPGELAAAGAAVVAASPAEVPAALARL